MKSIIVGTAGHIDHGKTALVKALTGIDADRLEEEKRRGITIDLGFAHLELPAENGKTIRLGFIDVPGHERFVRNMLAGIGGIDVVMLVIAADESIKPQTREHFEICRLLSVKHGITVLTKSDAVDMETLDAVRLEVEDFVRGSFLENAQTVAVSSTTGAGIEELKRHLATLALEINPRSSDAIPRLPVDRVFSMKGFGTVATGTLISGVIRREDELEIFPDETKVRVRGVQVHGHTVDQAAAGQRTAVNLSGVAVEKLKRGVTLSFPGVLQASKRFDAAMSLLSSARPLKHRSKVRLHAYAMDSICEVFLHEEKVLNPGEETFAQLRLTEGTLLLPGDRFVIRQISPVETVGGGLILDNAPPARIKNLTAHLDYLETLKTGSREVVLRARIFSAGTGGMTVADTVARTGWTSKEVESIASTIPEVENIGGVLIGTLALRQLRETVISSLDVFHKHNPLVGGMSKQELCASLPTHPAPVFEKALLELSNAKKIEIAGEVARLAGRGVVMKDEEAESKRLIELAFSSAGLKVPALKEVLAGLKIDKIRAQKIVTLLLQERTLVKVSAELVFHSSALEALRKVLAQERVKSPKMDVARFKDLTGVSRKYAIPLLEYLDRARITRRVGDERVIL